MGRAVGARRARRRTHRSRALRGQGERAAAVITLVLGGARSGKSVVAERLAAAAPQPVTYVATACAGDDLDHAARIAVHRARRDPSWTTVEAGAALVDALRTARGTVLVDSIGTWVAAHDGDSIVVSEEVGLGVHPSSELGVRFRDVLGAVNVALADFADRALLVV